MVTIDPLLAVDMHPYAARGSAHTAGTRRTRSLKALTPSPPVAPDPAEVCEKMVASTSRRGELMLGERHAVDSADGTSISVVSSGRGSPLLLVHGGMTSSARWAPLWPFLTAEHAASAMDRRGRGASGDSGSYSLEREFEDVTAVADDLARRHGSPVDVFGHSIGAVCVLGAAAAGAPFRRIALYEPPGPQTVPGDWVERATAMVAAGQHGRAMFSFLTEVIGLAPATVASLRDSPAAEDALGIVAATLAREARALTTVDLDRLAQRVAQPVLLLLGTESPDWATAITHRLAGTLHDAVLAPVDGHGHEGVDTDPRQVRAHLAAFLARS
jgi:pimeloyl-ACP methyl ester carboxylesterase